MFYQDLQTPRDHVNWARVGDQPPAGLVLGNNLVIAPAAVVTEHAADENNRHTVN